MYVYVYFYVKLWRLCPFFSRYLGSFLELLVNALLAASHYWIWLQKTNYKSTSIWCSVILHLVIENSWSKYNTNLKMHTTKIVYNIIITWKCTTLKLFIISVKYLCCCGLLYARCVCLNQNKDLLNIFPIHSKNSWKICDISTGTESLDPCIC